ncbi:hypothetical protein [Desulforamulus aeronauticus]|uniref:Uncharacterized protein n=1 Tax=Desulforamulus aeronauticus DSM 10349 TaxID=1121421 RepID=A0A1M6VLV7_9FIRM|nr:hypothetical protein [Desulforamulus aeronauticus]SHK82344.1 hypothetical protein SAMN02745123_03249 [Desulforamulus aeronauticus DSM 10349]
MAKGNIKKNLSDQEMMAGYQEDLTFENAWLEEEAVSKPKVKTVKKAGEKESVSSFFTPELQEQVGRVLLELKLDLYKQGIIDYRLEVSRQGNSVVLTAVNAVSKKKDPAKSTGKRR